MGIKEGEGNGEEREGGGGVERERGELQGEEVEL